MALTDSELVALAVAMRRAQRDYYRLNGNANPGQKRLYLVEAKELESRFDREVAAREADRRKPNTLF